MNKQREGPAPAEYMVRPPMPPLYFFLIDVLVNASKSGMLEMAADFTKYQVATNVFAISDKYTDTASLAYSLYKGSRNISSKGDSSSTLSIGQLVLYCSCGILAALVGGLLGLGGGFIMGPLFLELGVPLQVSSAKATFAMTFSSSMSVVEYYLIKRIPVPYAIAAFVG